MDPFCEWRRAREAPRNTMNATTRKSPEPASYEQAVGELEQLVQQLESGQMGLDDTLQAYARGQTLLRYCRERLAAVEQRIEVLDGAELKPYADGERDADA